MFLNPTLGAALDRITERAADVRRAFTPGANAQHDDVATRQTVSDFTLDPLSVSIPDDAYLVTRDASGATAYTRDGALRLRNGALTDAAGRAVCGIDPGSGALRELRLDPVDDALARTNDPSIEPDGSVVYRRTTVDPRSGNAQTQRVVVGRIALARFPAATRMESSDGVTEVAPAETAAQLGVPGSGTFGLLTPMHRDRSRIDVDESLVRLKDAYDAFDALAAAEAAKSHLGKTAMDLLK